MPSCADLQAHRTVCGTCGHKSVDAWKQTVVCSAPILTRLTNARKHCVRLLYRATNVKSADVNLCTSLAKVWLSHWAHLFENYARSSFSQRSFRENPASWCYAMYRWTDVIVTWGVSLLLYKERVKPAVTLKLVFCVSHLPCTTAKHFLCSYFLVCFVSLREFELSRCKASGYAVSITFGFGRVWKVTEKVSRTHF